MQKINIVLPVKNGEKYIADCIESILEQTYTDYTLLVFDDNSSDHTLDIIHGYNDSRIKVFSGKNGFIKNLNKGIEVSDCVYLARMDADDIMHPSRLEIQLKIMENLQVDVGSSWMIFFGENTNPYVVNQGLQGLIDDPLEKLSHLNYIANPAAMIRKEFLIQNNIRYIDYPHAEDYKFYADIARSKGTFYIESKPLVAYRVSNEQTSRINAQEGRKQTFKIQTEIFKYLRDHQTV